MSTHTTIYRDALPHLAAAARFALREQWKLRIEAYDAFARTSRAEGDTVAALEYEAAALEYRIALELL